MDKRYIYKYENKINGKVYIGQTVNLNKRHREHKNAATNPNSKDHLFPIHQALKKYGVDNFTLTVLEECAAIDVNDRERYWIDCYNSYHNGYNATEGGQDGGGYNGKGVLCYDLDGNFICSYKNAKVAAQELNVGYSCVQQVLHGERPTCKQRQLKYKEDDRTIGKFKSRQGGSVSVYQIDKETGKIICEWISAAEAARTLDIDSSAIIKCTKGKLKSTGGYCWRRA